MKDPDLEHDLRHSAWKAFVRLRTTCSLITNSKYKEYFPDEIRKLAIDIKKVYDKYREKVFEKCIVNRVSFVKEDL